MSSLQSSIAAFSHQATKATEPAATKVAKKAPATKKVAGPKSAKKATPKAAKSGGRSRHSDDSVIHVLKTDHGLKGKRGIALDAMKNGMTLGQFRSALEKREQAGYCGWSIRTALALKTITIREAK